MTDTPDEIFQPFTPSPPTVPEQPEPETQPAPTKAKRGRPAKASAPEKPTRQPRARRTVPPVEKKELPFNAMLAAMSEMKAEDAPMFRMAVDLLIDAPKPHQKRILDGLAKVLG